MLGIYQTYVFFLKTGNKSINASQAILNSSQSIPKLTASVALTEIPIQIFNQAQPYGAPTGSDQANCIQLAKTVTGTQQIYSISIRWDTNTGLFGLYQVNNGGCSTQPSTTNSILLSPYVYKMDGNGQPFFTGLATISNGSTGVANSNITSGTAGYYEINFNFATSFGVGVLANGLTTSSARLVAPLVALPICRIASLDNSWFTDFGTSNKIRTATVQIYQNYDSYYDRLTYIGSTSNGLVVTPFQSIGLLHFYASAGFTVTEWISILSNVIWQRTTNAPAFTSLDPPRKFTYSIGEGLTFSPYGPPVNNYGPPNHFYIPIRLTNSLTYASSSSYANSFCYPSFVGENFLGQNTVASGTSCDTGQYPRLTGYLPTIITQGENNFILNTLLQMVYPQSISGTSAFTSTTSTSTGKAWLGGIYGNASDVLSTGYFRWMTGYEYSLDSGNCNIFAKQDKTSKSFCNSSGQTYVKLASNASTSIRNNYLYLDITNKNWNTWNNTSSTVADYQIVEFGNNRNAGGSSNTEVTLNSNLKLTNSVTQIPLNFFQSCQMTYSSN